MMAQGSDTGARVAKKARARQQRPSFAVVLSMLLAAMGSACREVPASSGLKISDLRQSNCEPATDLAVFRLIAATTNGASLPSTDALLKQTEITVGDTRVRPFYVGPFESDGRLRYTLILLDVSGSMSGAPFAAARNAALRFLEGFNPVVDRVAIAPFGSRDVASKIQSAVFGSSVNEVRLAASAIPPPTADANTALYSAVDAGLNSLESEAARVGGSTQLVLIVLTDGRNDVQAPDLARDPRLLSGDTGLRKILGRLQTSRVQILTIGFGSAVDEKDLRLLGRGDTRIVHNARELESFFASARQISGDTVEMAFALPRVPPSGRNLGTSVSILFPSGRMQGQSVLEAPAISPRAPEDLCTVAERRAALALPPSDDPENLKNLVVVLVVMLILLAVAALAIPRLIWNDDESSRYQAAPIPDKSQAGNARGRSRHFDEPTQVAPRPGKP